MNFDFDDDQQEIRRTARDMLAARSPLTAVREAAERGAYDPELWRELVELGWPGIAVAEEHGGGGLGTVELSILLEESGYALAGAPLLASACAAFVLDAAGDDAQRSAWLPRLAAGEAVGALALASDGTAALVPDAVNADVIVFVEDGAARLLEADDASVEPASAIDPTRRHGTVTAPPGAGVALPGDPAPGVRRALVAVSAELVGVCQRALDMTVAYVKERRQFDTPIGAFQAVSHRCAEMLLATEAARSATYAAAWAADAGASAAELALIAKAAASDAGREVTASAIQAHGGIGFTWEADVHWLYKRAQLDAALLGSAGTHRRALAALVGQSLRASR